jgi:quercetin dioxygenase-like cupin family protein
VHEIEGVVVATTDSTTGPPARPELLRSEDVQTGSWGESGAAGHTSDRIYALDDEVCQIAFELAPGGFFAQEGDGFDVYERDTVWRVLGGVFVARNPETGETHRLRAGDALVFGGDVWHEGFNYGAAPARVLELTAPPPTVGHRPVGRKEFPLSGGDAAAPTARVVREAELRWRLEGSDSPLLVGEILTTPALMAGEVHLAPGRRSDLRVLARTGTLYVLEGLVRVERADGSWFDARPADGVYLPAGAPHRLANPMTTPARALFQLAGGGR